MAFQASKSTPSNFSLVFPRLPAEVSAATGSEFTLHLTNAIIPSLTLPSITVPWMGIDARYDAVHHIDYAEWNITYKVDADFSNWKMLYKWMKYITTTNVSLLDHITPKLHQITANLIITDNFKNLLMAINFYSVFITVLGDVNLAYDQGEALLEGTATFKYSAYDITEL